jgi:serine protease inhibitor
MRVKSMVKCLDCKNLVRIYIDSAFAWFEEKRKCKVKNLVFNDYYEVEKEKECEHHKT